MALSWNVENIDNHKSVCWIETDEKGENGKPLVRMNPATEALIFSTMSVGIGRITEDNAGEFYARLFIMERVHGAMLTKQGEPAYLTVEDVQAHIGLSCNVAYETREEWARRMFVGQDDGLKSYGEKLMTDDERETHIDTRMGLLQTCAEVLYDHGNANVARIGGELAERAERLERYDVSVTSERARYFRSEQRKAVEA